MTEATVTVLSAEASRRRLTLRQVAVVEQLVGAAADEARERGYEGLTVRNVARRAGVAPATAYTYFASKDHLLAEVLWRRMQALPVVEPDQGAGATERVIAELRVLGLFVADDPTLAAACTTALLGGGPDVRALRVAFGAALHERLATALGDGADPAVLRALDLAYSGAMLWAGMGHIHFEDVPEALADAARLVLAGEVTGADVMNADAGAGVHYSPYDYAVHEDPYPTYARLRAEAPLYRNDEFDFWALSRHADVLAAFRDPAHLSNRFGVTLDPAAYGPHAHKSMSFLAMDPPRHTRMRSLVSKAFTTRRVAELEPEIRALAVHYLDAAIDMRCFDMVGDVAGKLPMDVISQMIGVPAADRAEVRRLVDLLVHREEGVFDVPAEGMEAALVLAGYFADMVTERRGARGDLTSGLIDADIDGDRLSDDEIISFLFLMVVAGNETTTKLLANAWYWAWRFPDQKTKALADARRAPAWVEETLRYDTSSQMLLRVTTGDVELLGTMLPEGERVLLLVGSANRDAEAFEDPDRYDLDRDTSKLISFGGGRHFCLGAPLARLEARVMLEELVARVADYDIDGPGARRVHSINVRGFVSLPTTVTARLRETAPPMPRSRFVAHPERRGSVVAGASSGIGAATAGALAAAGHPVVLGARRVEKCEDVAAGIRAAGGEAHVLRLDIAEAASVEEFTRAAEEAVGPIDIVVVSAGHAEPGTALDTAPKDFAHTVEVNLLGAHRVVAALGPAMVQRHHGDLVFVSSDIVRAPRPLMAAYMASKWGLEGFVRALALELEGTGVRATIVRPGQTLTGMATDWDPDTTAEVLGEWIRFGTARHDHFLRPPAVAAAVLAAVSTPPGTHLPLIEVQPEAPVRWDDDSTGGTP